MKTTMLKWLAAAGVITALSSCSVLTYEESVPEQARELKEFPEEYRGTYQEAEDAGMVLEVQKDKFKYGEFSGEIGKNVVVKPYQKYMVINIQDDAGYWIVYLAERSKDGNLFVWVPESEGIEERINQITPSQVYYDEEGELERVHIQPNDMAFKQIVESGIYGNSVTFIRQ